MSDKNPSRDFFKFNGLINVKKFQKSCSFVGRNSNFHTRNLQEVAVCPFLRNMRKFCEHFTLLTFHG